MKKASSVDEYIAGQNKWSEGLIALRDVITSTELAEEIKWGSPAYTLDSKIVVGFSAFKEHFAIWFHQGVFLKDPANKLVNAQEGLTKALRQWRFTSVADVDKKILKEYVLEAIENQKAGKVLKAVKAKKVDMPAELADALKNDKALKSGYDSLTPGKQREYAEYIGSARQEKTRISRLEKVTPMITAGVGLNDKYKK